ncbi:MAG: arsenate reductase ArsC [Chloroflexi bacterium]|nr:arsenate reductase ArsC [Chloroflexota bacterium]
MKRKRILFVCVHNSGRSQIATAFFNRLAGGVAVATSAGTSPAAQVNPIVAGAMLEAGIDIRGAKPELLTPEMVENTDRVVTMGCGVAEVCPGSLLPAEDWGLEDPAGKPVEKVREIRDEIRSKVEGLIQELQR